MKYFKKLLKHKFFVLYYGIRYTKAPVWNLIVHDWSKFLPYEYKRYKAYFTSEKTQEVVKEFDYGWLSHQNNNKHHWEYWITRSGHAASDRSIDEYYPLDIPEKYIREMIADWMAASRIYTGKIPKMDGSWDWFEKNWSIITNNVTEKTRDKIEEILFDLTKRNIL